MLARVVALLSFGASAILAGSASIDLVERSTPDLKSLLAQAQNKWCDGTQVFFPAMANYANLTTQRWTSFEAPSYVASIKPSCADDVAKVVSSPPACALVTSSLNTSFSSCAVFFRSSFVVNTTSLSLPLVEVTDTAPALANSKKGSNSTWADLGRLIST